MLIRRYTTWLHLVTALALVCSATAAGAQVVGPLPTGNASLGGRVVDGDSKVALANVVMTLTAGDGKSAMKSLTDHDGRYLFEGIAPGAYRLQAQRGGYGSHFYAQFERPPAFRGLVMVEEGRLTSRADFVLHRAGRISGRVVQSNGRPVRGGDVIALVSREDGWGGSSVSTRIRADADGRYVISDVPAGSYRVMVRWIDDEMLKARVAASLRPTYFPSTSSLAEATEVRVGVGQTVAGIDVTLVGHDLVRLSGHVLRGQSEERIEANLVAEGMVRTVPLADDGSFDIPFVKPGRYVFWARANTAAGLEAASMTLDVSASELSGLVLLLEPTGSLSGRVQSDDGSALPFDGLQVAAIQVDEEGQQLDPLPRVRVDVTTDGRFDVRNLFGDRALRVIGLPWEWELARVMHRKAEVRSFSVTSGVQTDDVTVIVRRRPSQ